MNKKQECTSHGSENIAATQILTKLVHWRTKRKHPSRHVYLASKERNYRVSYELINIDTCSCTVIWSMDSRLGRPDIVFLFTFVLTASFICVGSISDVGQFAKCLPARREKYVNVFPIPSIAHMQDYGACSNASNAYNKTTFILLDAVPLQRSVHSVAQIPL